MTPARSGSLAWRLTALGLAQLAVLTVVAIAIAAFTIPRERRHDAPPGAAARIDRPLPPRDHDFVHGPYLGPMLTLLAGVVVIGAGSYLSGRWIVRPLDALSRAARAVGDGNLSTRVGFDRHDEIGDVSRSFDEMAERVQGLLRAERELLANVSHELRTPLARIRVAMDLATEGEPEAARALVADIASDLGELESIIDDILLATRFEVQDRPGVSAGLPMSSLLELPAVELAERAVERFRARHPKRVATVVSPTAPSPSGAGSARGSASTVMVDAMTFRRVLDNLLENADKYSPDPEQPIALRVIDAPAQVVFEVEDHGVGIAAADLPNVFQPFFRGDRSRTRSAGGVGLGLTLAKRIVEAHGGSIALASEPGRGTTVRVTLPSRAR